VGDNAYLLAIDTIIIHLPVFRCQEGDTCRRVYNEHMTERERIREEEKPDNSLYETDGLPTDEENLEDSTSSYTIAMLSAHELKTINQAAEEIQIAVEQGSGAIADILMPDEPEPPIPDVPPTITDET